MESYSIDRESDSMDRALEPPHDATRRLMAATTRQEVCAVAVETAQDVLGHPISATWLYDPDEGVLRLAERTGTCDELFDDDIVYRPGNSLSWRAFETGEVLTSDDVHDEDRVYNPDTVVRAEIILPLGKYGVMNVGSTVPDAFGESDVRVARILAANIVSIVSHDLRNPLSVASGHLEHAREACECEDDALAAVDDAFGRMSALIDDLLTLASQGDIVDDPARIELGAPAERAWETVHTRGAAPRIRDDGPTTMGHCDKVDESCSSNYNCQRNVNCSIWETYCCGTDCNWQVTSDCRCSSNGCCSY